MLLIWAALAAAFGDLEGNSAVFLGGNKSSIDAPSEIISGQQDLDRMIPATAGTGTQMLLPSGSTGLFSDLNRITKPIAKLIAGYPPEDVRPDISSMIRELPQFFSAVFNKPPNANSVGVASMAAPKIDFTKIPPKLIHHVMRGGRLPGIPDDLMQHLIQSYIEHLSTQLPQSFDQVSNQTNVTEFGGQPESMPIEIQPLPTPQQQMVNVANLPPLQSLPKELIQQVLNGGNLPGFSTDQMNAIKAHYAEEFTRTMAAGNTVTKLDVGSASIPLSGNSVERLGSSQNNSGFVNQLQQRPENTISESSSYSNRDREHRSVAANRDGGIYDLDAIATEQKGALIPAQIAFGLGSLFACAGIITVIVIVAIQFRRRRRQKEATDKESTMPHERLHENDREDKEMFTWLPEYASTYNREFPPPNPNWDGRTDGWSAGWVYQPRNNPINDRMI